MNCGSLIQGLQGYVVGNGSDPAVSPLVNATSHSAKVRSLMFNHRLGRIVLSPQDVCMP